ncbi:MAG: EAL domain-containing protein [Campylobacterota bacterium]|nr:EAL domain-containing protein [Campylobacterota bacterium]
MSELKEIVKYTRKLNVLYVEDDIDIQKTTVEFFENFFDNIVLASDGLEAWNLYIESPFDIIITDISMPIMNGIELIGKIREKDKLQSIIVFSALNDASYMTSCISLNVDGYILKPFNMQNMLETLKKVSYKISFDLQSTSNGLGEFESQFNTDKLTSLKSHSSFIEDIANISSSEIPVMILINIDKFHIYNEIYGLDIGDEILRIFAKRLESFNSQKGYDVYRVSGDEFAFFEKVNIIDSDKYISDIEELVEYIESNPLTISGIEERISLSLSIGIAFNEENIYSRADMALIEARKRGRTYLGFSADLDRREELKVNLYWREEINRALLEKRVHAYYQAIVDKNKSILKYEALMRITQVTEDSTIKLISPKDFMDFSKVSKQYIGLTKIVIEEAFKTMIEYNVHVAINITYHDIENREINKLLKEQIAKHHLATKVNFDISTQVIFELLEDSSHHDYDKFVAFIDEYKKLGVVITIDNFGLGFANMSKISAMSPNYVKIDSSLIKNIATDKHAHTLVTAIVKFTKELGIKTIAEHVSSKEIFDISRELGIDEFQGYYFSEPSAKIKEEL